jgi:hypothetical protein
MEKCLMKTRSILATALVAVGTTSAVLPFLASAGAEPSARHAAGGATKVAQQACLAEVAKTANVPGSTLSVLNVSTAGSAITVMVKIPGATAPWSCHSDAAGKVQDVMFTGRDGD